MRDKILENIINIIRTMKEEMVVGTGGFTGSASASGPVAGFDPVMDGRSKIARRLPPAYRKHFSKSNKKR